MMCCSLDLPLSRKQEILSVFSQKLLNSGFSLASAQLILVHGLTRYLEMVRCSELPKNNSKYKPLYWNKSFNRLERKLKKFEAKSGRYSSENKGKSSWRGSLPSNWKGARPIQSRVHGMQYTTVLQVPRSKGSRLLKELARVEPRLSKTSGYLVKLTEKSGKPLSKMFPKSVVNTKCHREDGLPCSNPKLKGPSLCSVKNVVYEGSCDACEAEYKGRTNSKRPGVYIGQSYRSLYERAGEHMASFRREESCSFMFKHWAVSHKEMTEPPKFSFKVLRCHKDPLSRMVDEAVKIHHSATMNSKPEYRSFKLNRIKEDKDSWENLKD